MITDARDEQFEASFVEREDVVRSCFLPPEVDELCEPLGFGLGEVVALENLGEVPLPGTGVGTLGDGKYDALDDLRLWTLNPNAEADGQDFIGFG